MNITDPIADMLTRIRNANSSKHKTVDVPSSKMKLEIAKILKVNRNTLSKFIIDKGLPYDKNKGDEKYGRN